MTNTRGGRIDYSCDYCGRTTSTTLSAYQVKNRHFCRQDCYTQFRLSMVPGYSAVHKRLQKSHGVAPLCVWDESHPGPFEWANTSGAYTADIEDYLPLCLNCHRWLDNSARLYGAESARTARISFGARASIAQYESDVEVARFQGVKEAQRKTGVLNTAISNNLSGRSRHAGGFTWKYL